MDSFDQQKEEIVKEWMRKNNVDFLEDTSQFKQSSPQNESNPIQDTPEYHFPYLTYSNRKFTLQSSQNSHDSLLLKHKNNMEAVIGTKSILFSYRKRCDKRNFSKATA